MNVCDSVEELEEVREGEEGMGLELEAEGTPLDEFGELVAEETPEREASGFVDKETAEVKQQHDCFVKEETRVQKDLRKEEGGQN